MKKLLIASSIVYLCSTSLLASEDIGESLFQAKCATCHSMTKPKDKSIVIAPPARGVMFHMSEAFKTKEDIKAHIEDFVINPSKEKAICKSVKRFGVMPSQKDNITKEELKIVSQWMIENLHMDKNEHDKGKRKHKEEDKHK